MKILFFLFFIVNLVLSFPCEAGGGNKCFYIISNLATGSKNGSDWNNAANSLPSTLQRGWKYYFAAGTYGGMVLDDAESQQALISLYSATDANHGSNVGWSSSLAGQAVIVDGVVISTGYYVIDGQTGGGPGSWSQGYGFKVTGAFTQNYGKLISFQNSPNNITISHTEVVPSNTNFYVSAIYNGGTNGVISYCYVHDLYGTPFHIFGQWTNLLLEYNYVARSQSDAAQHAEGISDAGSDNVTIRNNLFEDVAGTAQIALITSGEAYNWEIYGNVFVHTEIPCSPSTGTCHLTTYDGADVISVIQDATNNVIAINWRIYNNAIINYRGRGSIDISAGSSNVQIYNNLWFCNYTTDYSNYVYIAGPVTYDYNYYSKCVFPYSFTVGAHEPPKMDTAFATVTTINTNPFVNWRAKNFGLTNKLTGYPGLALNTLVDGSSYDRTDPIGATRGADGIWDRGAYEFSSGASNSSTTGRVTSGSQGGTTGTRATTGVANSSTTGSVTTAARVTTGRRATTGVPNSSTTGAVTTAARVTTGRQGGSTTAGQSASTTGAITTAALGGQGSTTAASGGSTSTGVQSTSTGGSMESSAMKEIVGWVLLVTILVVV